MKKSARAIIVHQQNILLIERNKFGEIYYTLPGGGIEEGETADEAVVREIWEECSITVADPKLVYIEEPEKIYGTQYIFTVDYQDGEVKLRPDSIEAQLNKQGKNLYKPMWVPISKLQGLPFLSEKLKDNILKDLVGGFPGQPKRLSVLA